MIPHPMPIITLSVEDYSYFPASICLKALVSAMALRGSQTMSCVSCRNYKRTGLPPTTLLILLAAATRARVIATYLPDWSKDGGLS